MRKSADENCWHKLLVEWLTGRVLDRVHNLLQEVLVLRRGGRGVASFDVLEEECAQSSIGHQRQAEQDVGDKPPQAGRTPPGLGLGAEPPLDGH